ncbi:MAG: response regulator transcription factor [Chloroflexota bacterium]|nr:response regulator transcription factor [Chloroflexota bacterium]
MDTIRVLIADDHPFYREGVRTMLGAVSGIEAIGEAATGEEAIASAARTQSDVILMDIKMPGINGIEATRRIVQTSPHIGVLVVTMFDDDDSVFAAMRAGARGYLLKDAALDEVVRAITAVASGEAIFSPAIAQRLMGYFGRAHSFPPPAFPELTDREYEILTLIAQRRSNSEIAARLVLSPKTVRNHVSNILSKLQVADRTEAMMAARAAGLGQGRT